jgi:hypothetical protein
MGISRHVEMQDLPPVVADDEKAVQNSKRERWDGEAIHCRNCLAMVSEERQPSLYRIWISRSSPSRDTPFRDLKNQLEQFAVNTRRSPGRILSNLRKIKARTSLLTRFRPPTWLTLETHVQYKRNPARCPIAIRSGQRLPFAVERNIYVPLVATLGVIWRRRIRNRGDIPALIRDPVVLAPVTDHLNNGST